MNPRTAGRWAGGKRKPTGELRDPVPSERRAVRPPVEPSRWPESLAGEGTGGLTPRRSPSRRRWRVKHRQAYAAPRPKPITRVNSRDRNRVFFLLPPARLGAVAHLTTIATMPIPGILTIDPVGYKRSVWRGGSTRLRPTHARKSRKAALGRANKPGERGAGGGPIPSAVGVVYNGVGLSLHPCQFRELVGKPLSLPFPSPL